MNTREKDRLSPELSARIAVPSPERRAPLERQLGATAPVAVARRSEPAAVVHALLAIRAIDRLNGAFLVSLTIRDLFENPIVSDLVRVVERAQAAGGHACPPSIPRMARGAATFPGANSTN
jgi:hypothetical protein